MARLRSSRSKNRFLSRGLVGVMIVALALLGIYALNPLGSSTAAETPEPQAANTPVAAKATPDSSWDAEPAKPAAPAAKLKADPKPVVTLPNRIVPKAGFQKDAKALQDQGKLLEARKILNDALQSGTLDHATAEMVKADIRDLNTVIVFTPSRRYKDDPHQGEHTIAQGDLLGKIANELKVPYGFLERINATKANKVRLGQSIKTIKGPIHAVVSKKHFTMDLYLGGLPGEPDSMYLDSYKVGLGADSSTPTGTWEVTLYSKLVNPEWTNPRTNEVYSADDPKNPLGERWIGLTGVAGDAVGQPSYGIHGTIEPETIGTNASMGCIRLVHEDICEVYDMLYESRSKVLVVAE